MKLIADSGATKTDWYAALGMTEYTIQTEGINPFHQGKDSIQHILHHELLPALSDLQTAICTEVYFYGAGCLPSSVGPLMDCLKELFPDASITICSDLLGAARAVCGRQPGIACILGTGSNSCLYDGSGIVRNVPTLGYILGDEGSGAYLGKRFVGDCLKGQLPEELRNGWLDDCRLTVAEVLDKVYRQPLANRFLAGVVPYIHRHRSHPAIAEFLDDCFRRFFVRNVLLYQSSLPASFTGSVAWFFREEVQKAAAQLNISCGTFVKSPIEGLKTYHLN